MRLRSARAQLYTMLSFCLHLGNCDFEDNESGEGCIITTPETLEIEAEMLQTAPEDLGAAITSKTMGGGVIEVKRPFEPDEKSHIIFLHLGSSKTLEGYTAMQCDHSVDGRCSSNHWRRASPTAPATH